MKSAIVKALFLSGVLAAPSMALTLYDTAPAIGLPESYAVRYGVYMNVSGVSLTAALVRSIEQRMHEIVAEDIPIVKSRWTREQAIRHFAAQGQEDTVRLLQYRPFDHFDVYTCDGLSEYFYGDMVASTGKIQQFALRRLPYWPP